MYYKLLLRVRWIFLHRWLLNSFHYTLLAAFYSTI